MQVSMLKVVALLLCLSNLAHGQAAECSEACLLEEYFVTVWTLQFSGNAAVCPYVIQTLDCFNNNPTCVPEEHESILPVIQDDVVAFGCTAGTGTLPPFVTTEPPDIHECPTAYFNDGFRGFNLEAPYVQPVLSTQECTMSDPRQLQHCSLYALSNLRSFEGYRTGIENCRIPGWWYLIDNQDFSIAVEGINEDLEHLHTNLAKINVTFYEHPCSEEKSYEADYMLPLSDTFTDGTRSESNSPLQLVVSSTNELTTILATWINTTIVIRRYSGFLSVTVQVPGNIGFVSEGLCTGCPSHSYHNITTVRENMISACPAIFSNVSIVCFTESALANQFGDIHNNTYSEGCVFDVLMANTANVGMLLLHRAVGNDAKLLKNIGNVPPRPWPISPSVEIPSTLPTTTASTEPSDGTPISTIVLIPDSSSFTLRSSLLTAVLLSTLSILLLR